MNVVLIVIIYWIFIFTLIFSVQFVCLSNLYKLKKYINDILKNGKTILVEKYCKWQNKMTNIIIYNDNILYLV